ncbi:MAG TPA: hypothetical protein VN238_00915 [Solirubrobacteraceae bacterium]|nr:hypothetical protein [Solirubrobacteraceae bacterium]
MSLDRYLDDFGRELERAAHAAERRPSRSPRARILRLAGGAIATAVTITAILLALPAGKHQLDPVAEARAALGSDEQLIHFLLRSQVVIENPGGGPRTVTPPPTTIEYWTTTNPGRWRVAFSYADPKSRGAALTRDHLGRVLRGPVQIAYAENTQSTYVEAFDELRMVSGYEDGQASTAPTPVVLGNDPVASLRRLLDTGRLHDEGVMKVDGRKVRRLAGIDRRRLGSRAIDIGLRYDVDPQTSAPISVRIEQPYAQIRDAPRPVTVVRFARYERLALTPENVRLLAIQPPTTPQRVIRMTLGEFREALRRGGRR